MSDICEHETFRDICGVCHRNTIIEKQETEITALRAVNDALSEQMMTMIDNAGKVAALRAEVERLRAALRFYSDPKGYTDDFGDFVQVPDFYSELNFGATAQNALKETT